MFSTFSGGDVDISRGHVEIFNSSFEREKSSTLRLNLFSVNNQFNVSTLNMFQIRCLIVVLVVSCNSTKFLSINTSLNTFQYDGKPVFLSGANTPWIHYADDFGNEQSNGVFCALNETLSNITVNGGNAVRQWLFVDGANIPGMSPSEFYDHKTLQK